MKPETEQWVSKAQENLDIAGHLLELLYPAQCIFFSQQAVEMLLKAIWIERADEGLPRKTHDLVSLAKELQLGVSEDWRELLRQLSEHYIPTRYGDTPVAYSQESAENYYERTKEVFEWLQGHLS